MPVFVTTRVVSCLILTFVFAVAVTGKADAQLRDSNIQAVYKVNYNGINLGKLNFKSTIKRGRYSMESHTKLKVPFLGSIFSSMKWQGLTRTTGIIRKNRPQPKNYYFSFRSSKKVGKVDMDFSGNHVSRVRRVPNKKLSILHVPVTKRHLKNVMDPMSAIMLISRSGKSHRTACRGTVPIYDGKQRFNFKLSYKRAVRVSRSQSGGYSGPVVVCKVTYHPISGYKPNKKDIKFMVRNKNIELWLMPLPHSRNYAPYRFIMPLQVGTAEVRLAYFDIRNNGGRKIALVRN